MFFNLRCQGEFTEITSVPVLHHNMIGVTFFLSELMLNMKVGFIFWSYSVFSIIYVCHAMWTTIFSCTHHGRVMQLKWYQFCVATHSSRLQPSIIRGKEGTATVENEIKWMYKYKQEQHYMTLSYIVWIIMIYAMVHINAPKTSW